jgi:hypothetical protein
MRFRCSVTEPDPKRKYHHAGQKYIRSRVMHCFVRQNISETQLAVRPRLAFVCLCLMALFGMAELLQKRATTFHMAFALVEKSPKQEKKREEAQSIAPVWG